MYVYTAALCEHGINLMHPDYRNVYSYIIELKVNQDVYN